ncbi:MAG: diguanylate cyclase [Pseudomonadota bacterium]
MTYLIIALLLCSLTLSVVFLLAWQNFGRQTHTLVWSATFLAGAVQYGVNLLADSLFDDRRIYWVAVSALGALTVSLALAGFRLWSGRWVRADVLALTGFATVLSVAWFTFGQPHVGMQMFIGPAYGGVLCLLCAQLIYRQQAVSRDVELAAASVLALFGASQILAGVAALMQGPTTDAHWLEIYRQINFLILPAGYVGSGLFTVLIVASDLSMQMKSLANTDPMTGILNRRGFESTSSPLIARARRGNQPLSVIICDVDNFKEVNDQHGHSAGDRALLVLAKVLQASLREGAVFGRIGGEEFALALPHTDIAQAEKTARLLRRDLAGTEIGWRPEPFHITASFGVATLREDDHTMDDLLQRADRAMYRSKRDGRNRVSLERALRPAQLTPDFC